MRNFWFDPYLWVHVTGLAVVPLCLLICLLGFAAGDPWLPPSLELGLVIIAGSVPIVWMQWQRPFYIFSLLAVALQPEQLTADQGRVLSLMQTRKNPLIIGLGSLGLCVVLGQLYGLAAIAADVTPWAPSARGWGLLLAAVAFLASNLFLQVPLSVLQVLWVNEATFATTTPYPTEKVATAFTRLGWPVQRILPQLMPAAPLPAATAGAIAVADDNDL